MRKEGRLGRDQQPLHPVKCNWKCHRGRILSELRRIRCLENGKETRLLLYHLQKEKRFFIFFTYHHWSVIDRSAERSSVRRTRRRGCFRIHFYHLVMSLRLALSKTFINYQLLPVHQTTTSRRRRTELPRKNKN